MIEAYQRALAAFQVGRYDLCEQCVHDALIDTPNDVDLLVLLAHCKLATDQYAATRSIAQDVIRTDPGDDRGYFLLAWATISEIHYEPVDPRTGRKPPSLVIASERRLQIAAELAGRCLEIAPNQASNFALLAEIERLRDSPSEALVAAERGLAINPNDGDCARIRIRVLTELQRDHDATQAARQRLSVDPEDAVCHQLLANLYLRQKEREQALPHARQAVRLQPNRIEHRRLYWDCVKAGNPFFRPFVYWQYLAEKLHSLPQLWRTIAFVATAILGGVAVVFFDQRTESSAAPMLIFLAIGLLIAIVASERPCMLFVDLALFATNSDYRASVDRRRLAIDTAIAFMALVVVLAFACMAFEIFMPIVILLAGSIAAPTLYFLVTAENVTARIAFFINLILLTLFAYLILNLFSGSLPGSKPRLFSMYAFMAFLFTGIAGPALYGERLARRRRRSL